MDRYCRNRTRGSRSARYKTLFLRFVLLLFTSQLILRVHCIRQIGASRTVNVKSIVKVCLATVGVREILEKTLRSAFARDLFLPCAVERFYAASTVATSLASLRMFVGHSLLVLLFRLQRTIRFPIRHLKRKCNGLVEMQRTQLSMPSLQRLSATRRAAAVGVVVMVVRVRMITHTGATFGRRANSMQTMARHAAGHHIRSRRCFLILLNAVKARVVLLSTLGVRAIAATLVSLL